MYSTEESNAEHIRTLSVWNPFLLATNHSFPFRQSLHKNIRTAHYDTPARNKWDKIKCDFSALTCRILKTAATKYLCEKYTLMTVYTWDYRSTASYSLFVGLISCGANPFSWCWDKNTGLSPPLSLFVSFCVSMHAFALVYRFSLTLYCAYKDIFI